MGKWLIRFWGGSYLEIDGGVGVSIEELEVADAVAREEGTGHGTVESGLGLEL